MPCAYSFALKVVLTAADVLVAQSLADPTATVVPTEYSFAEYSLVSTAAPVLVAHSFAAPRLAVVVTFVPPTAHAFELKSVPVTAPSTFRAYVF